MKTEKKRFVSGTKVYEYQLTRKNIKKVYLRVKADGSLSVSAPETVPLSRIEAFLQDEADFIRKARQKAAAAVPPKELSVLTGEVLPVLGEPHFLCVEAGRRLGVVRTEGQVLLTVKNPDNREERVRVLRNWMWEQAREVLRAECLRVYPRFAPEPPQPPTLIFREMKSRWGVCRPARNTITLNLNLFFLPPELIEYVVCHEFAHFRHPDHSETFWKWLSGFLPDWKERRRLLRTVVLPHL